MPYSTPIEVKDQRPTKGYRSHRPSRAKLSAPAVDQESNHLGGNVWLCGVGYFSYGALQKYIWSTMGFPHDVRLKYAGTGSFIARCFGYRHAIIVFDGNICLNMMFY